jgi:hypothetical protein
MRRRADSNRRIKVLQTSALPLGYAAQKKTGAGNGTRTRDINLGKVALYQLSYSRPQINIMLSLFAVKFNPLLEQRKSSQTALQILTPGADNVIY